MSNCQPSPSKIVTVTILDRKFRAVAHPAHGAMFFAKDLCEATGIHSDRRAAFDFAGRLDLQRIHLTRNEEFSLKGGAGTEPLVSVEGVITQLTTKQAFGRKLVTYLRDAVRPRIEAGIPAFPEFEAGPSAQVGMFDHFLPEIMATAPRVAHASSPTSMPIETRGLRATAFFVEVFQGHAIRWVDLPDGYLAAVLVDVCDAVGIQRARDAVHQIDARHHVMVSRSGEVLAVGADCVTAGFSRGDGGATPAGEQYIHAIHIKGLARFLYRSKKPAAELFADRCDEILEQVRTTGSYTPAPAPPAQADHVDALDVCDLGQVTRLALKLSDRVVSLQQENANLKPRAMAWSALAETSRDYSVADAAKFLSRDPALEIGQKRLFAKLVELGMVYIEKEGSKRNRNAYKPMQAQVDAGRLVLRLGGMWQDPLTLEWHAGIPQLRITVKGLEYLHKKLGGVGTLDLSTAAGVVMLPPAEGN